MILEFLSVIGLAALKVIPGAALAIVYEFSPLEIFLTLFIGGMLGIVAFSILGIPIRKWRKRRMRAKRKGRNKTQNLRKARKIMRIWRKYGLAGIAFVTPPIISPPVGAIIAVIFGERLQRIAVFMVISMAFWAGVFAFLGEWIVGLLH